MTDRVLPLVLAVALLLSVPAPAGGDTSRAYPVVDLHVELPFQLLQHGRSITLGSGQADAVRLRKGGAIGVVLPLRGARRGERRVPTLERSYLHTYRALAAATELRIPGCRRARPGVRTWLSIAGAGELAESPTAAGLWVTRGVRFFGLTREEDNELATAATTPGPVLTGLTDAGQTLVRSIHRAGGIVDVSLASEMTIRDVMEISREDKVPVVATHAAARALVDDPRNLSDAQIRDIAATNGVIGVTFDPRLLVRGRSAELRDVVRHIRHIVSIAGDTHVAIGSGYEGIVPPNSLLNASRFPRLARALEDAGMPPASIRRVFATNALRVLCYAKTTR